MKKTISINVSGIVFHIEEDGYEKLKSYLGSIQRYFSAYEDSVEIIADIESRIAELFLAKLNPGKQVITLEDVDKLIATMGNVADFEALEADEDLQARAYRANARTSTDGARATASAYEETTYQAHTGRTTASPRKLYRDTRRKLLGGVAAGIAHYFNADPLWIRLLFLVFFFGLFLIPPASGFILILYVILWAVVPGASLEEDVRVKKLYRDPDRRVIGGVASGLASYFGVDETAIRLVFVLGIFVFGQGLLIYLVLWAITPEAKTLTERMEMQGEPVTLSNIESNIKKSLDLNESAPESPLVKILLFPFRIIAAVLKGLSGALGPILKFSLEALRVSVGVFLASLALVMLLALSVVFGACVGWFNDYNGVVRFGDIPLAMLRMSFPTMGFFFGYLALIIPTAFVGLVGLVMIARRKLLTSALGWSLLSLWVISLIGLGFTVPAFANDFQSKNTVEKSQTFTVAPKTLFLTVREAGEERYRRTELTLEGYDGPQVILRQYFKAWGRNRAEATQNANMMTYGVVQTDSVLTFDSNFAFQPNARFRAQALDMTLQIPYGQTFVMDESILDILQHTLHVNGYDDDHIRGNQWKFTKDSSLVCLTCPAGARHGRDEDRHYDGDDDEFTVGVTSDDDEGESDGDYTKAFAMRDFDRLEMGSAFLIEVQQGSAFQVEARGERDDVEDLDVEVSGNTLKVGYDDQRRFSRRKRVTIYVTMPTLRGAQFSGASRATVKGFSGNQPVAIGISGASQADIRLWAGSLDLEVSGASEVNLQGSSPRVKALVSGASTLDAFEWTAQEVEVEATGASTARVRAEKSLRTEASGASNIRYQGNPTVITNDASGASSVKPD